MTRLESSLRNNTGLTLIEILIYLSILGVFITSAFLLANQAIENAEWVRIKTETAANAEFVIRKIDWAMADAKKVNSPALNASSSWFSIDKFASSSNPIVFSLNNGRITLSKASGPEIDLTNNNVQVNDFSAEHLSVPGSSSTLKIKLTVENKPLGRFNASTTIQTFFVIE